MSAERVPQSKEDDSPIERSRFSKLRKAIAGVATGLTMATVTGVTAATFYDGYWPSSTAEVRLHDEPEYRPDTYNSNRLTLFISGLDRQVADDMADDAHIIPDKYGRVGYLRYDKRQIDNDDLRNAFQGAIEDVIADSYSPSSNRCELDKVELNLITQSAGMKIILEALADFLDSNPYVSLEMVLLDAAPYDLDSVKPDLAKDLIKLRILFSIGGPFTATALRASSIALTYPDQSLGDAPVWKGAWNQYEEHGRLGMLRDEADRIAIPPKDYDLKKIAKNNPDVHITFTGSLKDSQDASVNLTQASKAWARSLEEVGIDLDKRRADTKGHATMTKGRADEVYQRLLDYLFSTTYPSQSKSTITPEP